jgi:SPP1 family predicted phage head-tail adaptor
MHLKTLSGYEALGAMDRWITMNAVGAPATDGGPGITSPLISTWASIRGLNGEEQDRAEQIEQKCSHLVTIAWQPNVEQSMIVGYLDGGQQRTFQINYIEDADEHRFQLKLYCMEIGQNAGGSS